MGFRTDQMTDCESGFTNFFYFYFTIGNVRYTRFCNTLAHKYTRTDMYNREDSTAIAMFRLDVSGLGQNFISEYIFVFPLSVQHNLERR